MRCSLPTGTCKTTSHALDLAYKVMRLHLSQLHLSATGYVWTLRGAYLSFTCDLIEDQGVKSHACLPPEAEVIMSGVLLLLPQQVNITTSRNLGRDVWLHAGTEDQRCQISNLRYKLGPGNHILASVSDACPTIYIMISDPAVL